MHHHFKADPWYRQAAQAVLNFADIPQLYGITHHGRTSAYLMFSGAEGRLIVRVGTTIGGRLIDTQPAPRLADDRARWEASRDQIAALFTDAGFATPRPTRMGLILEVPEHLGAPALVHLERTGLARYTARVDGHPDLVAEIDGLVGVSTSRGYVLSAGGDQYPVHFTTELTAARAFAEDCGFGPQITISTST